MLGWYSAAPDAEGPLVDVLQELVEVQRLFPGACVGQDMVAESVKFGVDDVLKLIDELGELRELQVFRLVAVLIGRRQLANVLPG